MTDARASVRGENPALRKAAVLLVSLDPETASRLLREFDAAEQERIAREIVRLEENPAAEEERETVLREFAAMHRDQTSAGRGGQRSARRILEKIHPGGEARRMVEAVEESLGRTRFDFLKRADPQNVAVFLADENPQTIALVLSYLPPDRGARLLEALPLAKQQDVVRRLASLEPANPDVVAEVEKALATRLSGLAARELQQIDGPSVAASVLSRVPRATERGILEGLKADEPELAEAIRRLMFQFEEIVRVNDRGIQNLLKSIDAGRLSLALKTASPELREKFFRNMSQRAAERVREEMELLGPVRVADVESAQESIVEEILRLEEAGELVVEGRGGAESVRV